jgi:hypothetical protein
MLFASLKYSNKEVVLNLVEKAGLMAMLINNFWENLKL